MRIWNEAGDLRGTPGLVYLQGRGIDVSALPDVGHALRWHPHCPWADSRHGAIVALYTDAASGEPRAVHRTAVTPSGEKVGRMALGPKNGCVIRLWADDEVSRSLVAGEGIETVLAAATRITHRGGLLRPAWATGDANGLATLAVLPGVEALTILVDNDESGTGQRAAVTCSARWTAAGREVTRLIPRIPGDDFNNVVQQGRAA
jgi:hypothetical protein